MSTVSDSVRLPPGPALPRALQGIAFVASRRRTLQLMQKRYGSSFTIDIPVFGRSVVISDPALVKQLYMTNPEIAGNVEANLGRVLGRGSLFNLDGAAHRRQRKLLVPPFHGKRMHTYEAVIEEEFRREAATWPEGVEFSTLDSMMRITLNAILRAVFGAEGAEFEGLRRLLPPWVALASQLAVVPVPRVDLGRWSPWGRFNIRRREYDALIESLIDKALADPMFDERSDVLALLLRSRYEDGKPMTRSHIADELLTLLAAGHETTATTLAWAVERLRRHPSVLRRLVAEIDSGGTELLQATILEVQRTRPVIDLHARSVVADTMQLGEWVIPKRHTIVVGIGLIHADDSVFPDAARFNPDRFVGVRPDTYAWVPFGGGTRRCIGAAFANMEMNVVLRTMLHDFDLATTNAKDESWHSRGVASAPARGGRAIMHRRNRTTDRDTAVASATVSSTR